MKREELIKKIEEWLDKCNNPSEEGHGIDELWELRDEANNLLEEVLKII